MLTEREKEIAIECYEEFTKCRGMTVEGMFNLFLSRIREEQEAAAYLLPQFTGCSRYTERKELAKKVNGNIPLFTTPLAAPECKELVEASIKLRDYLVSEACMIPEFNIPDEIYVPFYATLAKHKAMMGKK